MTLLFGFVGLLALVFMNSEGSSLLFNLHSIGIVVGGTFVVGLLMTPWSVVKGVVNLLKGLHRDTKEISASELQALIKNPNAPIRDAYGLINQAQDLWAMGVTGDEFERLVYYRAESIMNSNLAAVGVFRNLGKYPPALGMVGTVVGMIKLFDGLSGGNQGAIGSQLALAMTATFYGLIFSNMLILPLADRLEAIEESRRENLSRLTKVLVAIQFNQPTQITEGAVLAA